MSLRRNLSAYWEHIQGELFPWLDEVVGPLTARHHQLVTVLEVARVEEFLRHPQGCPGRPPAERAALARAFMAKVERPKRGRPRKGKERAREAKPVRRLERQPGMSLEAMLADLPRLQAAHRRGRRRHPDQLPADVCFPARQPGGDPTGNDDGAPRRQPL